MIGVCTQLDEWGLHAVNLHRITPLRHFDCPPVNVEHHNSVQQKTLLHSYNLKIILCFTSKPCSKAVQLFNVRRILVIPCQQPLATQC